MTAPARGLELAALLSQLHDRTAHHLSASECETMSVADLLGLADAEDQACWTGLLLSYTDPLGAPWLRASIAAGYGSISPDNLVSFAGAQEGLFADLANARGEGRLPRLLAAIERTRLLIIDDWGPEPLTAEQRRDLLEIVDDRYDKGLLLITSQVPVSRWHEIIGDMTLGDAILDRVVHRAHRIELKGASLRKRRTAPNDLTADAGE